MEEKNRYGRSDGRDRAVALKYRPESDNAPKVVAKGQGKVAEAIIAIAESHDIHVHQDPDMVQVLSQLDLNEEIPADLYAVVAELLAFIYDLQRSSK